MDPSTLQISDVTSPVYWRAPFESLATVSELVEFVVLDIEPSGTTRGKYVLADAQVAPNNAFQSHSMDSSVMDMEEDGGTDAIYHTRTHLGGVLQPGDIALGYYLRRSNFNSDAFSSLEPSRIPDIILVKKAYPNRRKKNRTRNWRLKSIAKEATAEDAGALGRRGGLDRARVEKDYELFLRELEEDPELRENVNMYKADKDGKRGGKGKSVYAMDVEETGAPASKAVPDEEETEEENDFPDIRIEELLEDFEDMNIADQPEEEQP
jgi:nonsense-mediated mRNA decay protein 3